MSTWKPIALLLALAPAAQAADLAAGKQVFDRYCSHCHAAGVGHPGTQMLGWLKGDKQALLEQRTDLVPEYVRLVVRRGLVEMPAFRPTEINDAALADLAAYLARNASAAAAGGSKLRNKP